MPDYNPVILEGPSTFTAGAAITGGQVVKISADNTVIPGTSAAVTVAGVAAFDAASGQPVTVLPIDTEVVHETVTDTGGLTAGQLVMAGAAGTVAFATATPVIGTVIGVCTKGATVGNKAQWKGRGA